MTPVATANIHEVVSASLCAWITESLEQFGVDSRVFLRVIQSVLEQDIQSLRGEERLNDLWSYRLESIGSKRKPMSKEDLLRRVLLENMRPCFKEDESFIAEEFVDELLFRWNEEMKIKAETCRNKRERDQLTPDDLDEEKVEDTRDPVTQYHEAFPALVTVRIADSCGMDEAITNTQLHDRRPPAVQHRLRKGDLDRLPYWQLKGARGCRNAPGRFMDRYLGSRQALGRHSRHRWTDRGPAFGFEGSVLADNASGQFSVENYGIQSAAYQGSVFDRFVAQIFKTTVPQKGGPYPTAGRGPWHDRSVAQMQPFGPMPVGFLHRTIEKILSQGIASESIYGSEPGHIGVDGVCRQLPDVGGNHKLPIYMENEFGVLVCVSDSYGLSDAKDVRASDDSKGTGHTSQLSTDLPAVCISAGVAMPSIYRHTLSWTQSENQRMPYMSPSYWEGVDYAVDEDSIEQCLNSRYERYAASCLGFPSLDVNAEFNDDMSLRYVPESGAPPDYGSRSSVLGNFRADGDPDLWTRIPDRFVASPAEIEHVSRQVKDDRQGQVEGSFFADSSFALGGCAKLRHSSETAAVSEMKQLETRFDECNLDAGVSGALHRRARRAAQSECGANEDEPTSRSSQSIASLVAEISERDLMNHLATSLAVLFPDLLTPPRPLYLPEAEVLACIGVQSCTSIESRCSLVESYPYDYWLYLYSALSRGDVNVDQILNYDDFRHWKLCVLNQATGTGRVACTCGLCCRGSGCLMDSIHTATRSTDAINRTLSTRATEHPAELHFTDVDYNSGSCTSLKLALPTDEISTDEGIDIYEFVLNNSSQGKTVFSRHGFAISGEDTPQSDYGRPNESFVTDWNKIRTIWTNKDRSFSSDAHHKSIFLEELYEENNNKVTGSSNLFSWGSHWISDMGESKSGHMSSSCESLASPSALSVDFGYDVYGEMNEKAEDDFVFGRSSLPPTPSSVAFSQLLSSEEEVSCDGWRVALDEDSRWLNASLCRTCKACLDARRDSPASSHVTSSSDCGSPSLDHSGSPSLDSSDALQYVNLLRCVDDDDAGSSSEDSNAEETELMGCVHESKAFDETVHLPTFEEVKAIDDALLCSLGNSQQNVPYRSSSSLESAGSTDGLNSDEAASSLSFLSAKYSVDSKLCESDLSSLEPGSAEDDLLVESSQSDNGSGNYEFESGGACVGEHFEERPDFMHPMDIKIGHNKHELSFEKPFMDLSGVELVPKIDEDCGNTGVGFENFEQLRVLWKPQCFDGENISESDREDLGYDVFSPNLGNLNDPVLFDKSGLDTSVDPISKLDQDFENINSKSLLKLALDEGSSDASVTTDSLEDAGLEKIRRVKVLWDTGRADDDNAKGSGSGIGEEKVDVNKLDHLKMIWSQLPLESKNLEEVALAWHGQVPDYESITSFGLKSCFGQNLEATSQDVRQKLLQDSYNCLSTILREGGEGWDSVDGAGCQHPSAHPSLGGLGSNVDQPAMELETLLQEVEFGNSHLVAASSITGACLSSGRVDKAENRGWQEVTQIKSEGPQNEQDLGFKNFQGLASIWDDDKPCCEDVGSIACDLNTGLEHVTDLSVVVQMESGLGSVLNSCPDRMILESLEPPEFCCEAVGNEIQQFKGLKSIWEEPPMPLEPFPRQASFHAGFSTGITQMNEETVGCDIISDEMQNFEHIKCIWDAPQAIAECTQIPLHFQTQPIAESSSGEDQLSFELAANVIQPVEEDVDPEEQENLENNEELTLIWEKKKARMANVKTSVISAKEKCQPVGLLTLDKNQTAKEDTSINWDNKNTQTGSMEDFKIPIEEKKHSNSYCQKTLSCETYGEELCTKNIEQLKAIWDQSEPDMESGKGSITCWGETAPVTQNPAEELPEWDLSQIENRTVAEKPVWHPSKSNSNSSENLSSFWNKCELAAENLSEMVTEPAMPVGYNDDEHFQKVKCHWNDTKADLESASGLSTGWKKPDSDADAFAKLHCEVVLSDFESCKDKLDEKLLFNEAINVQDLAPGSIWSESENKPQFDDLTVPVDSWDATNRCHEQSLDPEKLNKLRALWEDNVVPQAESLRRVASLSCWEQQNPGTDGLRRISSESLWEPLDRSSENLSRADSALRWQPRDSSSESLRHVAEDFCWDNDAMVMDSLKQKSSMSCRTAENLSDTVPVWHDAQAVDNSLRSSQGGDNAFGEEFKELQSIWQNDQFDGENLNKFPKAVQPQDTAAVWSGTLSESRCLPVKFDSISQQQQLDAEDDESEGFTDEMMDKLTCELFYQIDQADCDPCYFEAGIDRNIWLCSTSNAFQGSSAYVGGGFGAESDELNRLISQLDERQFESRGFKGLLTDVGSRRHNLASEWQLVESFSFVKNDTDAMLSAGCDLWRLILQDETSRPKLVPSENTAFRDKIPHRFAYRYSFFDPREACRRDRSAVAGARTETIKHIYDPSHSIMRQLEDVFDDGQRLQAPEDAFRILPNRVFRPIGGRNSGRDSYPSSACSGAADLGDLVLQVRSPTLDTAEMLGPDSPYQLYFGAESKSFVPRFRVHKELEKSAQTGEATPPMLNNEAVCNMNVILSTMALLD